MPIPLIAAALTALAGREVEKAHAKDKRSKAAKKGAATRKANAAKKKTSSR